MEDKAATTIQRAHSRRAASGTSTLHSDRKGEVTAVYGTAGPEKKKTMAERIAELEKENKMLRMRLEPTDTTAAATADQAAQAAEGGFVGDAKGGSGGTVRDEAVDEWRLESWLSSLSLDSVVANALLKHLKKSSGNAQKV